MRHLIKNTILVVVSYSLALSAPVSARSVDNFTAVKNYVNGGGKKTLKGLIEKMESDLPTSFYDQALKKTRGADGKRWYQAAKLANNYIYLRFNNAKVFVRVTEDKGQTVFYANGIRIAENDFRNMNKVQNKLYVAYLAGLPSKKASLLDFFKASESCASTAEVAPGDRTDVPGVPPTNAPVDQCSLLIDQIAGALQATPPDTQTANELCQGPSVRDCSLPPGVCSNIGSGAASGDDDNKLGLFLFAAAAILILFLAMRNKKKKNPEVTPEVPEDENGVGRTPPTGGGVNCGGDGAQCPGNPTPTPVPVSPNPGTPTPPPTGGSGVPVSNDPNYYGMPVNGTDRPQGAPVGNPVFKTRGR